MATQTETIIDSSIKDTSLRMSELADLSSHVAYPDAAWSNTIVNYYKDYDDVAPPDTLNSTLSEHEMRMIRRSDESPYISKTYGATKGSTASSNKAS